MAKIISVFGPPSSGKTTVSVAIAEVLAEKGYNVSIVCCDKVVPTIPVLLPQSVNKVGAPTDKVHSIGKILSCVDFSESDVLQQCVFTKKYKRIILIGYAYGENVNSYPVPTDYDVYSFFGKLSEMVEYIVVDCGNNLQDPLCRVAMEHSDNIIRLAGSTYKDITYYASNEAIIPEGEVPKDRHIVVAPKAVKKDSLEYLGEFYGNIDYTMKYSQDIKNMMTYGEYFIKNFPPSYLSVIKRMLEEINFS